MHLGDCFFWDYSVTEKNLLGPFFAVQLLLVIPPRLRDAVSLVNGTFLEGCHVLDKKRDTVDNHLCDIRSH